MFQYWNRDTGFSRYSIWVNRSYSRSFFQACTEAIIGGERNEGIGAPNSTPNNQALRLEPQMSADSIEPLKVTGLGEKQAFI